jgi:hypothetical protein
MTRRIRRVVAVAGIGGEVPPLEELLGGALGRVRDPDPSRRRFDLETNLQGGN